MKVFYIFVTCVRKWQQKHTPKSEDVTQQKPFSNCVVEDILDFHKMTSMDLDDEYWETENSHSIPRYLIHLHS